MAETANAHFEAVIAHEPLSSANLQRSRRRRNVLALLLLPLDPVGSGWLYKPKAQHMVVVRRRDTKEAVETFEYLDAEEAAWHLSDLRARLQLESTADFCRGLGIPFPGV